MNGRSEKEKYLARQLELRRSIQCKALRQDLNLTSLFFCRTDVAGEVVDVGSSVVKFKAGDKIGGGLAEYAVAKERLTVARPEKVSAAEAHKALVDVAGIKLVEVDAYSYTCTLPQVVLDIMLFNWQSWVMLTLQGHVELATLGREGLGAGEDS
ncbi:hypothetical protein HAX54_049575 [Datura stramonium]|uniref:Uncharacterized protein n=1 Tax=Datura stramonium TaxID=4076 RepID=A0ABS8SV71_DATST|nr:hypothetical protein [Datura stramonium]